MAKRRLKKSGGGSEEGSDTSESPSIFAILLKSTILNTSVLKNELVKNTVLSKTVLESSAVGGQVSVQAASSGNSGENIHLFTPLL